MTISEAIIILILSVAGLAAVFWQMWAIVCSATTYRQRTSLIDAAMTAEDLAAIGRVSHDDHARALMWFRDPSTLYAEPLRSILRRKA